jgi:hypothetical protein
MLAASASTDWSPLAVELCEVLAEDDAVVPPLVFVSADEPPDCR